MLRGELGHEVGGEGRRVGERLVEGVGQAREEESGIRAQHELLVARAVHLRDRARVVQLVERALLEPDRERVHRLARLLRGEGGEERRVDAAREQHSDGDVGDQVRAHGVAEACAQLLGELRGVLVPHLGSRDRRGPRVGLDPRRPVLPDKKVPGRQLPCALEDGVGRRHGVEGEKGLQRIEVDRASRERPELRSEREAAFVFAVEEGLDAVAVAGDDELATA